MVINNIVGKKFGFLEVIEDSGKRRKPSGGVLWRVKCICGNERLMPKGSLERNKSCGCKKADSQSKSLRKSLNRGGYEEIYATHWNGLKKEAKKRRLDFGISAKYVWELFLKQNRACSITGVPLTFCSRCDSYDGTASLDRIDSTKGYVEGNVQWVHKNINMMKQQYSTELFFDWCKKVVIYNNL
jgi:hypothetical protein